MAKERKGSQRRKSEAQLPQNNTGTKTARKPGDWNRTRTGALTVAAKKAIKAASVDAPPSLRGLAEWMLPLLPAVPRVSHNLKCASRGPESWCEPLHLAVDRPWLALNTPEMVNAITEDCDHADLDRVFELQELYDAPLPNAVVIDPWTGRYHAIWMLTTPVRIGPDARPGPQALLKRAYGLLMAAVGGDPNHTNGLIKNPFGRRAALCGKILRKEPCADPDLYEAWAAGSSFAWQTIVLHTQPVELKAIVGALADELEPQAAPRRRVNKKLVDASGRNCTVFKRIGTWARDNYDGYASTGDFEAALVRVAAEANDFPDPLDDKELAGIVRSVAKWMRTKWRGRKPRQDGINRGVMGLAGTGLELKEKQRLAGFYGPKQAAAKTDDVLLTTALRLRAEVGRFTQAQLAEASGKGIATIKRRWSALLADLAECPVEAPVEAEAPIAAPEEAEVPAPALVAPRAIVPARPVFAPVAAERIVGPSTPESRAAAYEAYLLDRRRGGTGAASSGTPTAPALPSRKALSTVSS